MSHARHTFVLGGAMLSPRCQSKFAVRRGTDTLAKLTKPGMRPDLAIPLLLPGEVRSLPRSLFAGP